MNTIKPSLPSKVLFLRAMLLPGCVWFADFLPLMNETERFNKRAGKDCHTINKA